MVKMVCAIVKKHLYKILQVFFYSSVTSAIAFVAF